jgi:type II secretory pathway pseudopilin PulG
MHAGKRVSRPLFRRAANGVGRAIAGRGFTYVVMLIAIAILGVGLAAIGEIASTNARYQRDQQMTWIGSQFVDAIGSYYYASPGATRTYPQTLDDLVQDKRYPNIRRHLRQIYLDPFTGKPDWLLVPAPGNGFRGVTVPKGVEARQREYDFTPTF